MARSKKARRGRRQTETHAQTCPPVPTRHLTGSQTEIFTHETKQHRRSVTTRRVSRRRANRPGCRE
jgi:hypothetical protein